MVNPRQLSDEKLVRTMMHYSIFSSRKTMTRWAFGLLISLGCMAGFTQCSTTSSVSEQGDISVKQDYFPEKVKLSHARGFRIQYRPNYKVVDILSPFEKSTDTARYILLQRGTPRPKGYADRQIIEIPLRTMVGMSSLHIGLLSFLSAEDVLIGLGDLKYVSSPKVIERINEKKITQVGKDQTLNEEVLVALKPDLVMTVGQPNARMDRYQTLNAAGVPVLINSEWVENTPLGRAEWVKLMAALLNKEALVNQKFAEVEKEYKRLAGLTKNLKNKPSIITGTSYKDAWYVPNGDSYMAQFFRDAGTTYHWDKVKATGSLPLNFEAVYPIGLKADYWLNVGISGRDTKKDILDKDSRYGDFKAFKTGQLYNYSKRTNARGSNDYWESGAVNPHLILSDLIKILHPELLHDYELYYYKKLQ
ncbi:ABC transporter substrate-binding protein [Siphonobacter sp. SORGH_AS_0500]|uniref:ABC transporter substrate-binding protein n=1 Tax=Siphonobacter sp. SORGH_AS_0500 TaxID=1864824 RepID=UPI001E44D962|nr:ABC transporter substrate-binding protein [Siphonobacter sp. SORGH_AS_0500]